MGLYSHIDGVNFILSVSQSGSIMKIGDVAKQLDMPASTIRYYEKRGLIKAPDRVSGKRDFNDSTLVTLRLIKLCQAAGFSISEIRQFLERHQENPSLEGLWLPDVDIKRKEIRQKIKDLQQIDSVLSLLMTCKCKSIEQCVGSALASNL